MRMMKQSFDKKFALQAVALSCFLFGAEPSRAAFVTFSFDGSISEVGGVLFPTIGSGSMSGNITFDQGTVPIGPGVYLNSIKGLSVKINNVEVATQGAGANGIVVQNSPLHVGADNLTAFSTATGTGSPINGESPVSFHMSLTDPIGNVFSSQNIPSTPPSLSSFAGNQWRLNFGGTGNYIVGSLAHMTLTAVPLPAAVVLFGIGLISLVGLGAGGLRNLRGSQA